MAGFAGPLREARPGPAQCGDEPQAPNEGGGSTIAGAMGAQDDGDEPGERAAHDAEDSSTFDDVGEYEESAASHRLDELDEPDADYDSDALTDSEALAEPNATDAADPLRQMLQHGKRALTAADLVNLVNDFVSSDNSIAWSNDLRPIFHAKGLLTGERTENPRARWNGRHFHQADDTACNAGLPPKMEVSQQEGSGRMVAEPDFRSRSVRTRTQRCGSSRILACSLRRRGTYVP